MIADAIYHILSNDAGLTALVSDRIYPLVVPQGKALPAVTFTTIDLEPTPTKDSSSALDKYEIQVTVFAGTSYAQLNTLESLVRTALDRPSGSLGGVDVHSIQLLGAEDIYEADSNTFSRALRFDARRNP